MFAEVVEEGKEVFAFEADFVFVEGHGKTSVGVFRADFGEQRVGEDGDFAGTFSEADHHLRTCADSAAGEDGVVVRGDGVVVGVAGIASGCDLSSRLHEAGFRILF